MTKDGPNHSSPTSTERPPTNAHPGATVTTSWPTSTVLSAIDAPQTSTLVAIATMGSLVVVLPSSSPQPEETFASRVDTLLPKSHPRASGDISGNPSSNPGGDPQRPDPNPNGNEEPASPAQPVGQGQALLFTFASSLYTVPPGAPLVMASQTALPGGASITVAGTPIALATEGLAVVIGTDTMRRPQPAQEGGSETLTQTSPAPNQPVAVPPVLSLGSPHTPPTPRPCLFSTARQPHPVAPPLHSPAVLSSLSPLAPQPPSSTALHTCSLRRPALWRPPL